MRDPETGSGLRGQGAVFGEGCRGPRLGSEVVHVTYTLPNRLFLLTKQSDSWFHGIEN